MRAVLAVALTVLLVGGAPPRQRPVALRDATVVAAPGVTLEHATIVLRGGLIEAVGPKIDVPADARIIDAKDLTIYAGFIDAATTVGLPEFKPDPKALEAVESKSRDYTRRAYAATQEANRKGVRAELKSADVVVVGEDQARKHLEGGFTSAHVVPTGAYFGGRACLIDLSGEPRRNALVRTALGMAMGFGAAGDGYPSNDLGIMAHLRQLFLDAQHYDALRAHDARRPRGTERPPHDPALQAIAEVLARRTPVIFESDTDVHIDRVLAFAGEFGFEVSILGGRQAHRRVESLKRAGVSVLLSLKFEEEPKGFDVPESAQAERKARWEADGECATALHRGGVPFAFSTRGLGEPKEALKNLALRVERGLPHDAALAALTTVPAAQFGVAERLGTLEPGKIANLVALTARLGDPRAQVRYAFVDGKQFEFEVPKLAEPDLAGAWIATLGAGPDAPQGTLELKQEGTKLTGSLLSAAGKAELGGTVAAGRIELSGKLDQSDVGLTGVLKDAVLTGSLVVAGSTSPLSARRQKKEAPPAPVSRDVETDRRRVPVTRTGGHALVLNARLLTVSPAGTIDPGWILIENGRIQKLGAGEPPATAHVRIDASGLTIIPGIIDCHSHIAATAINESSYSISAEVRIKDVLDPHDEAIYRAAAGGCTAANVLHGSANTIGGQNGVIRTKWGTDAAGLIFPGAPQGIKFALGENVKQSNWTRRGTRYPGTRMGVESVLRTAFLEARDYRQQWAEFARRKSAGEDPPPPRRDLRLEALVGVLEGKIIVHCHGYRADELLMLLRVAEEFGFRVKTLQHVLEGYKIAPEIAAHGAGGSTFADWWAYKIEAFDAIPYNAALMTRAGVVTSINSDSANHIRYLNLEAAKAMKYGRLSADEALRLVTLNPAIQLAIQDQVGSIEAGKRADLAFYNGHPLSPYSRCVMTMIDGEVVFEDRVVPNHATPNFDPDKRRRRDPIKVKSPDAPLLALTNARVVPVTRKAIPKGTVLIERGKIKAVGEQVQIPEGASVIDLKGLSVYPGLIDAGTTLGLTEIGSVAGTNDIAEIAQHNPELKASTAFNPHSEHVPVARANGITSVVTAPRGGLICGQAALMRLDGWTPGEALVADEIGLVIDVPIIPAEKDEAKVRDEKLKELRELLKEAAELDALIRNGRAPTPDELKAAALAPYAAGRKPIFFRASGRREIRAAIALSTALKLKPVIVGGAEAWKCIDELKKNDVPVILGPVLAVPRESYDPYDAAYFNAARLQEAGVRFCLQTSDSSDVRNLPYQAAVAAAYGLARADALKAITIRAAEILGVADRLGSIEEGKVADLIVTTGDPLEIVTDVALVLINGRPVSLETRHTRLYEKFKQRIK
jgi:imidazolonepropionase-like amidohydrolase